MEEIKAKISFRNELIRKLIHIFSSVIPFFYLFTDYKITLISLSAVALFMILVDVFRFRIDRFNKFYLMMLNPILRKHEKVNTKSLFTGGTYIVIGYLLCVIIFPREIAITSMLIAAYSDTAAALIGKSFGKIFVKNKTVEGSVAFFLTGVVIILLAPKHTNDPVEVYIALSALLVTTFYELIPVRFDDNIFIPLFFGFIYYGLLFLI